jgi:polar amino acid transport system substrate-binding protein
MNSQWLKREFIGESWMKKVFYLLLLIILLPSWLYAQPIPSLLVMTEDLPPFNFEEDGRITGISTDVVRHIFRDVGVEMKQGDIQLYPWARAYHDIKFLPETALFSMARTDEREELFRWVGPLLNVTIGVVARKDRKIDIESINDFNHYRIGTVRDGAPEQLLIKAGVPLENLERLALPEQNIRKLSTGRIDLFVFNVQTIQYKMVKLGVDPGDYETVYLLKTPSLYLALHKDTDSELVDKLQKSLDGLKKADKDGVILFNQIVDKYLSVER